MSTLEAAQNGQLELDAQNPSSSIAQKPAIVRSARACTVCRTAKMRCIGADDGAQQCQRCKRQNLECIFEKHRRGRKPGSKLSEHSKMLRRLEREMKAKAKEAGVAPPPKPKAAAAAASAATTASSSTSAPPPIQTSYKQSVPASVPGAGPVAQSTQQPPHELVSSDLPHHSKRTRCHFRSSIRPRTPVSSSNSSMLHSNAIVPSWTGRARSNMALWKGAIVWKKARQTQTMQSTLHGSWTRKRRDILRFSEPFSIHPTRTLGITMARLRNQMQKGASR